MESLKSDLKNVQSVIKDLLGQLGRDMSVASWCFPQKLAATLDPQEVLLSRDCEEEEVGDRKILLMELLVDRLLLLLQCCIRFSETVQGQKLTSLPLTIGSTVKKFSRKIQQDQSTLKLTREKLKARDQRVTVLESTISELQRKEQQSPTPAEPSDSVTSRCTEGHTQLPYEALGTMRMNYLTSSVDLISLKHQSKSANEDRSTNHKPPTSSDYNSSVAIQTTETAFALCVHCSVTHRTMADLANTVSSEISAHKLNSALSTVDWNALAAIGGLDSSQWGECLKQDLETLSTYTQAVEDKVGENVQQLEHQRVVVMAMEEEMKSLNEQVKSLQANVEEVRCHGNKSLAVAQKELGAKVMELQECVSGLQRSNTAVREELGTTRSQEALLRTRVADIESAHRDVMKQLSLAQTREMALLSSQQALEQRLERALTEESKVREDLKESRLQLAKTRVVSQTMENKSKALVSKQSSLLTRLEELDSDTQELRGQLWALEGERTALSSELATLQNHCQHLTQQLDQEKEKLSMSVSEGKELRVLCSELETQIITTRGRLEQEQERCRLLMDYPFVKQNSDNYGQFIASLSPVESQRQVSANTVRILLLEEQNSELRGRALKRVKEGGGGAGAQVLLNQPVRTWQDGLLTQVQSEQATARQATMRQSSAQHRAQSLAQSSAQHRPQSSSSLKGRLGHLVSAIADTRASSIMEYQHKTDNN